MLPNRPEGARLRTGPLVAEDGDPDGGGDAVVHRGEKRTGQRGAVSVGSQRGQALGAVVVELEVGTVLRPNWHQLGAGSAPVRHGSHLAFRCEGLRIGRGAEAEETPMKNLLSKDRHRQPDSTRTRTASTRLTSQFLALTLVVAGASACGVSLTSDKDAAADPQSEPVATTIAPTPSPEPVATTTAPSPKPKQSAASGDWLYDIPGASNSSSGERISTTLQGDSSATAYKHATTQWVGCEGEPATTTYQLDENYSRLKAQVGLQKQAPDGLVVVVDISTDEGIVQRIQVEGDGGTPVQLNLVGVSTLTFEAIRTKGTCKPSAQGYLVLGDAILQ